MVNFGLNSASILGLFLAVAGASLYFIRTVRPELSRDHDIFFAAVGLLCGMILLFQGWRLDPILQFGQFLLSGSAIFFAVESIRLRGIATEQARRNTPIVDDERTVSRVYRAELDQLEPYEEEGYDNPRLRGYPDRSSSRRSSYEAEEPRTNPKSRPPRETTSKSRPRSSTPPRRESYDSFSPPPSGPTTRGESNPKARRRPSQPKGKTPSYYDYASEDRSSDYVDYQPIDPNDTPREQPRPENNPDSPPNFDY